MAALGIHQHGIENERIALPFPPWAFRPTRHVDAIAALEHDALDRLGGRRARLGRALARLREVVPGGEWHERRDVDARLAQARDEGFEPRAPLGEGLSRKSSSPSAKRS